ncbi:MAG: dihydroorotate dehydrogenase-like protein [Xanthomonadales bacterium]|jgi:dihydroorotate dehydrogenase (fumarate)|nr:dihydroorotate dehydrogenase-like protein [Xanthomonadales bacterium]
MDLSTQYLGLTLKNPLVPSASPLSRDIDTAKRLEDAGASAIVMYSLFEEEIRHEDELFDTYLLNQDIGHAEADSYRPFVDEPDSVIDNYLAQLERLKQELDIPVIASLNGVSSGGWVEHAKEIQQAGADALELNVYYVAADINETDDSVTQRYIDTLQAVKACVDIPLIVKISPYFSSVANMVRRLEAAGADGVSLFNRFYQPGIDLESLEVTPQLQLSRSSESLLAMRWIAMLYNKVDLTLAATGGIHNAEDVMRLLLAGADVTHMCAALLMNSPEHLASVLQKMQEWMEENEYESVSQLKGSVSQQHAGDPAAYERANYIEVLRSL